MEITQIKVNGRIHLLKPNSDRSQSIHQDANYMNTGLALCGILKPNESIEEWVIRMDKKRAEIKKARKNYDNWEKYVNGEYN